MDLELNCIDCMQKNQTELGMPGFELLQTRFTFTEAVKHVMETGHYINTEIRNYEEEE